MMKRNVLLYYMIFLLLVSTVATAFYQFKPYSNMKSNLKELDDYLVKQNFSGSVLVGYQGEILFEKSYGYQDQQNNIKNSSETAYLTGSITKQFTAAAILQLQEQGKLNVEDTIDKYYPDYPNGENITIHQLLTHTAGLPEYLDIYEKDELVSNEYTVDQIITETSKLAPKSKPGENFEYNNTDYFMLGGIIEKVSEQSFEEYVQQHIFEPAGMDTAAFGYDPTRQSQMAVGYMNDEFEIAPYVHPTLSYGGGAFSASALDLYRWDQALYGEQILSAKSKEMMFTSYTSESLLPNQAYGYGQYIVKKNTIMYHPGFITGFSSNMYRETDKELVIIALSNTDSGLIPMIPALLNDFSKNIQHSYIGYGILAALALSFIFIVYTLLKWIRGFKQGTVTIQRARWFRIVFQTIPLQLVGLLFIAVPFLPGFFHELFSSTKLLLVAAPVWGTIVNLLILLFVLFSIAGIQPFIQKTHVKGRIENVKEII